MDQDHPYNSILLAHTPPEEREVEEGCYEGWRLQHSGLFPAFSDNRGTGT